MKFLFFLLSISTAFAQVSNVHCNDKSPKRINIGTNRAITFASEGLNTFEYEELLKREKQKDHLDHCLKIDKYGCLYKRKYLIDPHADTLVIYLRGHWKYKGKVPSELRKASIKEVISTYELGKTYEQIKTPMLISSSSNVGFTIKEIENAIEAAGLPRDSKVILASHSGAYHGLDKTLKYLKRDSYDFKLVKIIMLDNFYFGSSTADLVKEYIDEGVECTGFLTAHNLARYKARFKTKISENVCPIQTKSNHYTAVNKCLESYVQGNTCFDDPK